MPFLTSPKHLYLAAVVTGAAYGLLMRLLLNSSAAGVLSVAFLIAVPIAIGYLAVDIAWRVRPRSPGAALVLGWPPLLLAQLVALATLIEGSICILFALPITLIFCSVGGLMAHGARSRQARHANHLLIAVLALPLCLAATENRHAAPPEFRTVRTSIDINASPQAVWNQIVTVPAIHRAQLPFSCARAIGFPRPIKATLSGQGIGAVRHARFAGGLTFIETVDRWQPGQRLGFTIHALTAQIPAATLDAHVRVGGTYFDVLRGDYRIEPLGPGRVRLHLASRERVSTDLNLYAAFWADAVMRDIQQTILTVIRQRAQGANAEGRTASEGRLISHAAHPASMCALPLFRTTCCQAPSGGRGQPPNRLLPHPRCQSRTA